MKYTSFDWIANERFANITADDIGLFCVNDGPRFVGVNCGRWNGWACPLLFVDQLNDVIAYHTAMTPQCNETGEEIMEFFHGQFSFRWVMFNGYPRLMVDVGTHNWVWEDAEPEDDRERQWISERIEWLKNSNQIAINSEDL